MLQTRQSRRQHFKLPGQSKSLKHSSLQNGLGRRPPGPKGLGRNLVFGLLLRVLGPAAAAGVGACRAFLFDRPSCVAVGSSPAGIALRRPGPPAAAPERVFAPKIPCLGQNPGLVLDPGRPPNPCCPNP